jgi:hypothetical protein
MVWTYYCKMDDITLAGSTKEELAERLMDHANEEHEMEMTFDQALMAVSQDAKQEAA